MTRLTRSSPTRSHAVQDWHIDDVVAQLRMLRKESLAARCRIGKPVLLPSRTALTLIIEGMSKALFPNRLGSRLLLNESVDYFVGHTLDVALRELSSQVLLELQFVAGNESASDDQREQMVEIVREFAHCLPKIRALLETDISAAYDGDPAARSVDEVLASLI